MQKLFFCLIAFFTIFFFSQAIADPPKNNDQASELLQNGKSWYQLALALDIDSKSLRNAQEVYEQVLVSNPTKAERSAANAGIKQTTGRLENSDEMFRNVWPGAWKLLGEHSAYEKYDSHVELALDQAWGNILEQLQIGDHPRIPIFPRCKGDKESCEILRDMVLLASNDNPTLRGLTDDMIGSVDNWEVFSTFNSSPTSSMQHDLNAIIPEESLLIADILVHPEIYTPDPVAHVSVSVHLWEIKQGNYQRLAFSEAVGVNVIPRWWHSYLFAIILVFGTVIFSISINLSKTKFQSTLWAIAFIILGVAITVAGLEFLDTIKPEMSDLAWDPNGNPLPETWPWGLAFAGALILGPAIISFITISVVQNKIAGVISFENTKQQYLSIPTSVGVTLLLTTHMPTLFGNIGISESIGLLFPILTSSTVMGIVINDLLDDIKDKPNKGLGGLLAFVGGTLSILLFLLGLPVHIFAFVGMLIILLGYTTQGNSTPLKKVQVEKNPQEPEYIPDLVTIGSLDRPLYFDRQAAPLQKAMDVHKNQPVSVLVIHGVSGAGKTSYVNKLLQEFRNEYRNIQILSTENSLLEQDSGTGNPYATLIDLLGDMLEFERLMSKQEKRDSLARVAQEFSGAALEIIPGVGLLMGILPEDEAGNLTNDKLVHDIEIAIRSKLTNKDIIWFIDDIQGTDQESLDVLIQIITSLKEKREPEHGLHIIATEIPKKNNGPEGVIAKPTQLSGLKDILKDGYQTIFLPPLHNDEVKPLLRSYGIDKPSPEFINWVSGRVTTPADVMSVLKCLAAENERFKKSGGKELPTKEELKNLDNLIPTELLDRELTRLMTLSNDNLLLLELAAQLGRCFDADDLAAGMQKTRFNVLQQLRHLETNAQLIIDTDEEDVFSFELESSRQALIHKNKRRKAKENGKSILPELTCEFHGNVARHLDIKRKDEPTIAAERIVLHGQLAGSRHRSLVQTHTLEAAEDAAKVFSWERCLKWVDQAKKLSIQNANYLARITLVEAKANNGIGQTKNIQIALDCYKRLLDNKLVDQRDCLLRWLRINYDRKDIYIQLLLDETPMLRNKQWKDQYVLETINFYDILSENDVRYPARIKEEKAYRELIDKLNPLRETILVRSDTTDQDQKYRETLLSFIENKLGETWSKIKDTTKDEAGNAEFHLKNSASLKEKWGDLDGLALTYGSLARYHKESGNYQQSIEFFEKDIELNEQCGGRKWHAKLLNELAEVLYLASLQNNKEAQQLSTALELVTESFQLSTSRNDAIGSFYAGSLVILYSCEIDIPIEKWNYVLNTLSKPEFLEKAPSWVRGYAKGNIQKALNTTKNHDTITQASKIVTIL
jgi:hypothetical protein